MAVLIPDDFFEADDQGAQGAPLLDPFVIPPQVSKFLDEGKDPCLKNKGLFMYNPATGRSMTLPCRSRTCTSCGKGWARNWQDRLGWNEFFHNDDKALTLTTAYDPGHKPFWRALEYFWRALNNYCPMKKAKIEKDTGLILQDALFRKVDAAGRHRWMPLRQKKLAPGGANFRLERPLRGKVEAYFGITEYDQGHKQPHFHFVLRGGYIPQKILSKCWQKAQIQAGFEKVAFDVRIEKIRDSVKQYFFKYITKLTSGKDELPRPEQWKGRGVRYSRKFFAAPAPQVAAAIQLTEQNRRGDYSKFHALYSRKIPMAWQVVDADAFHAVEVETVAGCWDPFADAERAGSPQVEFYSLQFIPHEPGTAESYGFG